MAKKDCQWRVQDHTRYERLTGLFQPIGIFDSGIGGLSILKALRVELPFEDFIYIADSGHAPYGEREDAHVITRSLAISKYLVKQNIKALVVACNTATAAAIDLLRATHPGLAIIGVEPALKPAAAISRTKHIGVMATRGTLTSDKFKALLRSQAGSVKFTLQPCDGLADAIERSATTKNATELIAACAEYTSAIGNFGIQEGQIDTLVLGCTHYPFVEQHLRQLLGPNVQVVETGEAVARQTRRQIVANRDPTDAGKAKLFSTGDVQNLRAAGRAWLGLTGAPALLQI